MAKARRQAPPTHPTVWVGLGLAAGGLLVAAYAYTGTRVYDVTFAVVALLGGLLALGGILTAAWGRAVMAARAQRSQRGLLHDDALRAARGVDATAQPPTIAAPVAKRSFDFARAARRLVPRPSAREKPESRGKALFAFRSPAPAEGPVSTVTTPPLAVQAVEAPVLERVTVECPECETKFSGEGVRPFTLTCPSCGYAAEV